MADNVELRIVLVDENGVATATPGPSAASTPNPQSSTSYFTQPSTPQPVSPATVAAPPQQPITVQASNVNVVAASANTTSSRPTRPETVESQTVGPDSKETKEIFGFKAQAINEKSELTSDYFAFKEEPKPRAGGPDKSARSAKEPKKELTIRDEAKAILAKRQRDAQVKAELDKLDPPKSDPANSATTKAFGKAARTAYSAGFRKTAQTLGNATQVSAQGGMTVGGAAVAASFAVGQVAIEGFTIAARAAKAGVEDLAIVTTQLARGQNLAAIMTVTDAAVSAVGKIPIIGGALEAGLGVATTAVKGFTSVVQAFVDRGAELAKYSAEISQARSMADLRQMQGDIREAQALGPSIARLTEIQSEASDSLREILLPIKQIIIEDLSDILKQINDWLKENGPLVAAQLTMLVEQFKIYVETKLGLEAQAAEDRKNMPRKIIDAYEAAKNKKPPDVNSAEDLIRGLKNAAFFQFVDARDKMSKPRPIPAKPAFVFGGGSF